MAYDNRYKNADVHGCTWYRQNAQRRDREISHRDTREDKSPFIRCFSLDTSVTILVYHNRTSMVKYVTVGKDMTVVFWDETGI